MQFILTVLKSFSEVFFQENAFFGVLILIGLAVISPISALFAVIGSFTANLTGSFLETNKGFHGSGVYGLNGVLIGTAIAFYLKYLPLSFSLVIVGSIIAAIISSFLLKTISYRSPYRLFWLL